MIKLNYTPSEIIQKIKKLTNIKLNITETKYYTQILESYLFWLKEEDNAYENNSETWDEISYYFCVATQKLKDCFDSELIVKLTNEKILFEEIC